MIENFKYWAARKLLNLCSRWLHKSSCVMQDAGRRWQFNNDWTQPTSDHDGAASVKSAETYFEDGWDAYADLCMEDRIEMEREEAWQKRVSDSHNTVNDRG